MKLLRSHQIQKEHFSDSLGKSFSLLLKGADYYNYGEREKAIRLATGKEGAEVS